MEGKGVLRVSSSRVSRSRYLLAKRKRSRRRAKAWKEKKSHASLFPLPFCLAEEARETREGMEGKGLPRASSVPLPFSQAEEVQETREGKEGKGVPRVSSSRFSCFHYLLA